MYTNKQVRKCYQEFKSTSSDNKKLTDLSVNVGGLSIQISQESEITWPNIVKVRRKFP